MLEKEVMRKKKWIVVHSTHDEDIDSDIFNSEKEYEKHMEIMEDDNYKSIVFIVEGDGITLLVKYMT